MWYFQVDQQGSVRVMTNSAGSVISTYSYDAYGNVVSSNIGVADTSIRYDGQLWDYQDGLYYLRARYYDSTTAQFISRDPAVESTREPYGYAMDTPLDASDPSGLGGAPPPSCLRLKHRADQMACQKAMKQQRDLRLAIDKKEYGGTVGACFSASAHFPEGVGGTVCVAMGSSGKAAFLASPSAGVGWGAGFSGGVLYSGDATDPSQLKGPFLGGGGTAGPFSASYEKSPDGKTSCTYVGAGPPGASGYGGGSDTFAFPIN
jgi:RHS repeat-associated protein